MDGQGGGCRLAVIGTPIEHSLSALLHEAVFKETGLPWQTDLVDPGDLEGFLRLIEDIRSGAAGYSGANITIPYKKAILPFCDELLAPAQRCGAVNTLLRTDEGRLIGSNSDSGGFIRALQSELHINAHHLRSAVICGTGGVAHAVAGALVTAGVPELVVLSRTQYRAEDFIAELQRSGENTVWSGAAYHDAFSIMDPEKIFDLCVNATPLGMLDDTIQEMPKGWLSWLNQHARSIFDAVYRRNEPTLLVQWAHKNNIPATDGLMMLIEQAIISLRLLGVATEPDEMRAIMKKAFTDEGIARWVTNQGA
ncbi:MAG: shikimate dehydrogenase [Actinomycetia bacterium]|nr:shikimate dehydrogenase [Actinomycetes bacterium]